MLENTQIEGYAPSTFSNRRLPELQEWCLQPAEGILGIRALGDNGHISVFSLFIPTLILSANRLARTYKASTTSQSQVCSWNCIAIQGTEVQAFAMTSKDSIIIFGPTGHVGSSVARAAHQQGAKVYLAMRDPQKAIPGLSFNQEQEGGFKRVYADLTKPDTLHNAVIATAAKRAFIYLIFGTSDYMKSSIMAIKSAGVDLVVFLSSHTVPDNMESISPSNFIAWGHGQVEIIPDEVFGPDNYVAVRPGSFASNSLRWKKMVMGGEVKIAYPEALFDWISPGDIGRVCGRLVAEGPQAVDRKAGKNVVRLCGPEVMSQRDAIDTIGRVIGQDIKVTQLDEQEGVEFFMKSAHLPESAARQLVQMLKKRVEGGKSDGGYEGLRYEEAVANIQKYGGRRPTSFHQWVEENKGEFSA